MRTLVILMGDQGAYFRAVCTTVGMTDEEFESHKVGTLPIERFNEIISGMNFAAACLSNCTPMGNA